MDKKLVYEARALNHANDNGVIFYEVEGNIMRYEEQVLNGLYVYGLYEAQVNLDTMEKTGQEVKSS